MTVFADAKDGEYINETPQLPPNNSDTCSEIFLGRHIEMSEIMTQLRWYQYRVISICGERGIGKTSIALNICSYANKRRVFEEGIVYVPLATTKIRTWEHILNSVLAVISSSIAFRGMCDFMFICE